MVLLPQVVAITLTTDWEVAFLASLKGEPIRAAPSEAGTARAFGHGVGG